MNGPLEIADIDMHNKEFDHLLALARFEEPVNSTGVPDHARNRRTPLFRTQRSSVDSIQLMASPTLAVDEGFADFQSALESGAVN